MCIKYIHVGHIKSLSKIDECHCIISRMKDFDAWNKVKQNTHVLQTLRYPKEGEIWWCKLGLNIGDEQDGKGTRFERPVVIINNLDAEHTRYNFV